MNVGLSRAKEFLILIVNKQVFKKYGSRFMQQLWSRIEAAAEKIDPTALLRESKYLETAREIAIGRQVAVEGKHVLFTEQDFYPAITGDLASAHRNIVIFSAFMTKNGATRWLAVLSKAMTQGAAVQIVTKTLDKQPQAKGANGEGATKELSELIKLMRRSGIAVDLRSETHEKVIVIDEQIVWNGSLNMLSHVQNAAREHMTRTNDGNYSKEILKLLSRHDIRAAKTAGTEHPVCPACGAKTFLSLGYNGVPILKCEDECGWTAPQEAFKKLSQGIPIGIAVKPCPEPGCMGSLKLRYSYRRYCLRCSSYNDGCQHKEDVHVSQYQYNPFPQEGEADLSGLSGFEWPQWKGATKVKETLTPVEKKPNIKTLLKVKTTAKKQAIKTAKKGKVIVAQDQPQETLHPNASPAPSNSKKSSTKSKTTKSGNKKLDFINGLADKLKLLK